MLRHDGVILERADAEGGEIARDAANAGGVAAVGRDGDVEHHAAEPGVLDIGHADGRIVGQDDDALMVVAELELHGRAEHAVAGLAADDDAGLELEILAGDPGAGEREDRLHAGRGIGRAAHNVDQRAGAGIDLAQLEVVGIGVRGGRHDFGDDEGLQRLALILDAFDLEADHGQRLADLGGGGSGLEVILEPVEGELHR